MKRFFIISGTIAAALAVSSGLAVLALNGGLGRHLDKSNRDSAVGSNIVSSANTGTSNDWYSNKLAAQSKHDAVVSENEKKAAESSATTSSAAGNTDSSSEYTQQPVSKVFDKAGTIDTDFELPLSYELQKPYDYSNVGYSAFNVVVVGCLKADPQTGYIYNRYVSPYMDEKQFDFQIKNSGKLTLVSIKGDTFYFKTSTGKTGSYDAATRTYKLDG